MSVIKDKVAEFEKNLKFWNKLIKDKEYFYGKEIEAEIAKEEAVLSRVSSSMFKTEEQTVAIRARQKTLAKKKEHLQDIKRINSDSSLSEKRIVEEDHPRNWEVKAVEVLESDVSSKNDSETRIVGARQGCSGLLIVLIVLVLLLIAALVVVVIVKL